MVKLKSTPPPPSPPLPPHPPPPPRQTGQYPAMVNILRINTGKIGIHEYIPIMQKNMVLGGGAAGVTNKRLRRGMKIRKRERIKRK